MISLDLESTVLKRLAIIFLLLLVMGLVLMMSSTGGGQAQTDPTPTRTTTLHIVQRDQTLSEIAQLYNTSVDAIMTMNGISDARFIDVGQRLLIPDAQVTRPGANFIHTVGIGDTLENIALRYAVPVERLIAANGIVHPDRLYIGQALSIGEIGQRDEAYGFYTVRSGDNILRVAAQHGMTRQELMSLNNLDAIMPLVSGQQLMVVGGSPQPLPAPFIEMRLTPESVIQGQSLSLQFQTQIPMQVAGRFMGRAFETVQTEDGTQVAILAVHSLSQSGVYSIQLQMTDAVGQTIRYDQRLQINAGPYGNEVITIPADRTNLLEPTLVQSELDQVAAVMSGFRPERYFDGLMSLPSTGPVTSQYGTRRSYNGSPIDNNFHGGTDFGGPVGAPITAPADGIVVLARPLQVRGNVVILDHGWGVYSGYWHLSQISVVEGQQVTRGELLGDLGNTGLVTGAHLHWEMWVQGVQVDPMQWVQQQFP